MSKQNLSERQEGILHYIWRYMEENGRPPTIREIGRNVKISSTSVVNYNLTKLKEKGFLDRDAEVSRGLRLTDKATQMFGFITTSNDPVIRLPLAGMIVASEPIEAFSADGSFSAYDEDDAIEIAASMLPRNRDDLYALKVSGDSMIDAMVSDGDIVIVRKQVTATNGDMVAALIETEGSTTLKHFYHEGEQVRLQPANPTLEAFYYPQEEVTIQGKVVMVLRQPKLSV